MYSTSLSQGVGKNSGKSAAVPEMGICSRWYRAGYQFEFLPQYGLILCHVQGKDSFIAGRIVKGRMCPNTKANISPDGVLHLVSFARSQDVQQKLRGVCTQIPYDGLSSKAVFSTEGIDLNPQVSVTPADIQRAWAKRAANRRESWSKADWVAFRQRKRASK